jgi:hypothetical protein
VSRSAAAQLGTSFLRKPRPVISIRRGFSLSVGSEGASLDDGPRTPGRPLVSPGVAGCRVNFRSIRQQRCLEVASRPAMSPWSMGRVGLIDITVGNAARLGASQRSTTRRCASHHIATQRASRWGHPGGSRAFSAAQRQLSPTCLNPCLVPDDCFCRYQTGSLDWQKCSTAQAVDALC